MAHASRKHMGVNPDGKGNGAGALVDMPEGEIPENMALSNRDKQLHHGDRGLDSRRVQTDQLRDHVANHNPPD